MTQVQLASSAGLNVRTIRRIESGDSGERLQISTTNLLAEALELDASERALLLAVARGAPVHAGIEPHGPATPQLVGVPLQLPNCSPVFTGRVAELAALDGIAGDPAAMVVAQIDGMAGVGKTALVTCLAQRLAGRYPDGQIFLDLHAHTEGMRPVEPDAALEQLLRALGVANEQVPGGLDERAALYRSRLAGRRVLLVFDNVLDERQIAPLLPGAAGGLVLITGRRRLVGLDLTRSLTLDVMTPADSVALFAKVAGHDWVRGEPADGLHELVELCGRLPMAMRIAGARMRRHPAWKVADLVERLRDHRSRASELDAGPGLSITAMLDVSYQHLAAPAQRLYRLLGLHPGPDITVDAVAALAGSTPRAAERQVEPLLELQLLHEHAPGRFRFHDLTRHDAAARCGRVDHEPDRRAAVTRLLNHYCRAAEVAMDAAYPFERDERPHLPVDHRPIPDLRDPGRAMAWLDAELPDLLAAARHAAADGWPRHLLHLAATIGLHLRMRCHYADAEDLHSRALATAVEVGDADGELGALLALGRVRHRGGSGQQAIEAYERALPIAQALASAAAEVEIRTGMGDVHRSQGRRDDAIRCFDEARRIAERSPSCPEPLEALCGLGWLHLADGSRYGGEFERVLGVARRTGQPIFELQALRGLGHRYRRLGRYEKALDGFEAAAGIARRIGSHYGELGMLVAIGWVHRLRSSYDDAIVSYTAAIELASDLGAPSFRVESLLGIGQARLDTGRLEEALGCYREALATAIEYSHPAHRARAHAGIACALRGLGNVDEVERHWRAAVAVLGAADEFTGYDSGFVLLRACMESAEEVEHAGVVPVAALPIRLAK